LFSSEKILVTYVLRAVRLLIGEYLILGMANSSISWIGDL
jgi:hypothetical protein